MIPSLSGGSDHDILRPGTFIAIACGLAGVLLAAPGSGLARQSDTTLTGAAKDTARPPADSVAAVVDTLPLYEIGEVVVTATRSAEKIIDVPYPAARVTEEEFKHNRKTAIDDALESIPGLMLQSRYGNHDVRVSIRGFGSRSNSGIRGVRILLDGIPESEPDGQTRIEAIDFHSVGSIEVVRGNLSSAYTNAPGGVINFINDLSFRTGSAYGYVDAGSAGLRTAGAKAHVLAGDYRAFGAFTRHEADGYRAHSADHWNILNTSFTVPTGGYSNLTFLGYYVDGEILLPGSLTQAQFDADPFQANPRDVSRDSKRVTKKGRLGLRFETFFGPENENTIEATGYGTIKYFERVAGDYRFINRNGLGGTLRYSRHMTLGSLPNEISAGGDLFFQDGPVETYDNIGGRKSDVLTALTNEAIGNAGFYFQDRLTLVPGRLDLLMTVRYDNVTFDAVDQLLGVRNSRRVYSRATPKFAANFKFSPSTALYASYGLGFDTPAANELENYPTSSDPTPLLNPDLEAQDSRNFEVGVKGSTADRPGDAARLSYEAAFFTTDVDNEIVPFEVFGDVYYRNAASTRRNGIEIGGTLTFLRSFTFRGSYTWSDFSYTSYIAASTELDTSGNLVTVERDFTGNLLPSIPEHNIMASLAFEQRLGASTVIFVKPGVRSVSGMEVDDANSARTESFTVWNVASGVDLRFGAFRALLTAGATNLGDLTHVEFVNINSLSGEFYEAGEPRSYYGSLNFGYSLDGNP